MDSQGVQCSIKGVKIWRQLRTFRLKKTITSDFGDFFDLELFWHLNLYYAQWLKGNG